MEEQRVGPRPVTAVVLVRDEELRGRIVEVLADYFADVRAYERPVHWPSLGEILANRCYRTERCFAQGLVLDDTPDSFCSGRSLLGHQKRQGCRCLAERPGTRLILTPRQTECVEEFQGVLALPPSMCGAAVCNVASWAEKASRLPRLFPPEFAGLERRVARQLFMRCPYTGKVLAADSLQGLIRHFHDLGEIAERGGHKMKAITVLKLREANWCDAEGKSVPPPAELDRLRVAH